MKQVDSSPVSKADNSKASKPDNIDVIHCSHCAVCKTKLGAPELDLGAQPLCDDLIQIGDSRKCKTFPIQILLCPNCFTANQAIQLKKEILFPQNYHYRPRFTLDVLDGMKGLVAQYESQFGLVKDKLVCDIGCNDGSLLNFFKERGARTCGIEPTGAALEAQKNGHDVEHLFFDKDSAKKLVDSLGFPDVITFTNVFAHIQDLDDALASLRLMVKPDTVVLIENHYLGAVLDTNQFDTFYHEHPRTYSLRSFEHIASRLGGSILGVEFPKRYGGNIRVCIGQFGVGSASDINVSNSNQEEHFPAEFARMQTFIDDWCETTKIKIDELRAEGVTLHGKSFPGRAAILVSLLGLDESVMPVVYEKPTSLKIGHYLPGTRIEIVSDEEWMTGDSSPDAMLIWGWHIADEIADYLRESGFQGRLFTPLPAFREIL